MYAVIFEVYPTVEGKDEYLQIAAELKDAKTFLVITVFVSQRSYEIIRYPIVTKRPQIPVQYMIK